MWTTDACVPISKLAECIVETKKDLANSFLFAPIVGHVGDGNFHLFILLDPKNEKDLIEGTMFSFISSAMSAFECRCSESH